MERDTNAKLLSELKEQKRQILEMMDKYDSLEYYDLQERLSISLDSINEQINELL